MFVFESRASTILYNFLMSIETYKPFLLPANICPIVPLTFLKAQKEFELVDISLTSLCMSEEKVLNKLEKNPDKYGGVLFVRTYGIMSSFELFFKKIKKISKNLIIIDDRCLSIPEFKREYNTVADVILFSTGYSKVVDVGFGGFGFIKDDLNYERRNLEFVEKYLDDLIKEYKKKIKQRERFRYKDSPWLETSEPNISFKKYKVLIKKKLPKIMSKKEKINQIYSKNLPQRIQLKSDYQFWRFNILVPEKQLLLKKIFNNNLFASSHYASLSGIFFDGKAENAENLHSKVVNLFNDKYFDVKKAKQVVKVINKHLD